MKKQFLIIILLVSILIPVVSAETLLVNVNFTISADIDTETNHTILTIESPYDTQTFDIDQELMNNSVLYETTVLSNLLCSSDELNNNLANYTLQIIEVCKIQQDDLIACEEIKNTNTELSQKVLNLQSLNDSYSSLISEHDTLQSSCDTKDSQLSSCNSEKTTMEEERKKNNQNTMLAILVIGLGIIGVVYWKYDLIPKNRSKTERHTNRPEAKQTISNQEFDSLGRN